MRKGGRRDKGGGEGACQKLSIRTINLARELHSRGGSQSAGLPKGRGEPLLTPHRSRIALEATGERNCGCGGECL